MPRGKCGDYLRLVISGSSGFLGSNLVRYFLMQGYDVISLTRKSSNMWRLEGIENLKIETVDLESRSEVFDVIGSIKPDGVLHTASYGVYHFEKDREKIFNTNLFGTINLLDACVENRVKLFINTGSYFEYGIKNMEMRESDRINPKTDYAVSKALATQYCSYRDDSETKIVTLRLFTPYGYYEEKERLIPYLIYCSIKNQTAKISSLENIRDFIFIEDVDRAYEQIIENFGKLKSGSIFNVGSGVRYSIGEVIRKLNGLKIEVDRKRRGKENFRNFHTDITSIKDITGWKPKVDLEEGIKKTREWMIKNIEFYESDYYDKSKNTI